MCAQESDGTEDHDLNAIIPHLNKWEVEDMGMNKTGALGSVCG